MGSSSYTTELDDDVDFGHEANVISLQDRFFTGTELIGETFNDAQTARWYAEEAEAYQNLGYQDEAFYPYDALNTLCGFRHLSSLKQASVVGIGSAHGREFGPIAERIGQLTIVESDTRYWQPEIAGVPATYLAPGNRGELPVADSSADLLTCFGVLHHVARVSESLMEIARVLRPGGIALVREPIVSMGDWRKPRAGLTKNERGIPLPLFRQMLTRADLVIVEERLCGFAPLRKAVHRATGRNMWSSKALTRLDLALSRLRPDVPYHPRSFFDRVAPSSVFYRLSRA